LSDEGIVCDAHFGDSREQNMAVWWPSGAGDMLHGLLNYRVNTGDDPEGKGLGWLDDMMSTFWYDDNHMDGCSSLVGAGSCDATDEDCSKYIQGETLGL
jgi:hypothetical protein